MTVHSTKAMALVRIGQLALLILWWLPILPPVWQFLFPGLQLFTNPGIGINDASRSEIMALALLALACSGFRWSGQKKWSLSWSGWWGLAFLAQSLVSCLLGAESLNALFFAQAWFSAACVYLAVPLLRPERPSLAVRIAFVHLPIVLLCLMCLAEPSERLAGPFQLPGVLASWLLMVAPLAFHEYLHAKRGVAMLALVPSALAAVSLLLTISRAAWLVLLFGFVGLVLMEGRCSWRRLFGWGGAWVLGLGVLVAVRGLFSGQGLIACVVVLVLLPALVETFRGVVPREVAVRMVGLMLCSVIGVGLAQALRPPVSEAVTAGSRWQELSGRDNSAVSRIELWRTGLALGLEHPILGVGPGRFGESYPLVQKLYYYYSDSAHNTICEMAAELGFVGLGLFAVWFVLESRRLRPNPQERPWQRGLFFGVVSGLVYAQVEVSYHFAYLWVVFALVMSTLGEPRPQGQVGEQRSLWSLGFLPFLLLPLSVLGAQRDYARAQQEIKVSSAYKESLAASDQLPSWSAPALAALQYGLQDEAPLEELKVLAGRALASSPTTAVAYQFAADVAFREGDLDRAKTLYEQALCWDPYNYPGSYHGLLLVAAQQQDREGMIQLAERVLRVYDLSLMSLAHPGHRAQLLLQLAPLLYDVADTMSPYSQPAKTEPIYRFLAQEQSTPRALHGLGVSLWSLGQVVEGRRYLEEAHRLDPIYPAPPSSPDP